jgi:hypothetical protein
MALWLCFDNHIALRIYHSNINYSNCNEEGIKTLKNPLSDKKTNPSVFQVLLIDNDASDYVEVQEAMQIDFCQVSEHLKNGGSVFITSKDSQKVVYPKVHARSNYNKVSGN